MFAAHVSTIGNSFVWSFPAKHTVSLTNLRTALANHGFDPKQARQLCERHAFVRAIRLWLNRQNGGRVDHTISDVLDSRVTENKFTLKIQIDDKCVVTGGLPSVAFNHRLTLAVDKASGDVTATNADGTPNDTVKQEFDTILPQFQGEKNTVDLNNLIHRLFGKASPLALIPAVGLRKNGETFRKRGQWFVEAKYAAVLARMVNLINDIGGDSETADVYHFTPLTIVPTPSNPNPVTPSLPNTAAETAVRGVYENLYDMAADIEKRVEKHYRMEWKGATCQRKSYDRLFADTVLCLDSIAEARLNYGNSLPQVMEHYETRLIDYLEGIRLAMSRAEKSGEFVPAAPQTHETVSYVNDETDDISVIEIVHTPVA